MAAAAFFDLDRTLLRRSSALALAGSFRERGLISRRQLAKAAAWQLLFVLRGASHEAVRRAAEDGLLLLRGFTPDEMRDLVAGAMEPVLQPLVYAEPLHLVEQHRERGEPVYIVSATLQEIVEAIAEELGFDGALGTVCEVRDGAYTGRALRPRSRGRKQAPACRLTRRSRGCARAALGRTTSSGCLRTSPRRNRVASSVTGSPGSSGSRRWRSIRPRSRKRWRPKDRSS